MSEENTKDSKLYELGFHIDPAISEDQVSSKIDEIKKVLADNSAEIVKEGEPQAMKLAYEITNSIGGKNVRFNTSTFSWIKFNATSEGVEAIKEAIDSKEEIIRSLIVKTTDDEEHSTSKISKEEEVEEVEEGEEKETEEKPVEEKEETPEEDTETEEVKKEEE
jgi:ribosomal protein S6